MTFVERMTDARGTMEGKVIAIVLSVVLVFMLISVNAFAEAGDILAGKDTANSQQAERQHEYEAQADKQAAHEADQNSATVQTPAAGESNSSAPDAGQTGSAADSTKLDEAAVGLSLQHAYLIYEGQEIVPPANVVKVPVNQDMRFTVLPDNGYQAADVIMILDGQEIPLTPEADGSYLVKAADVSSRTTLVVTGLIDESALSAVIPDKNADASDADEAASGAAPSAETDPDYIISVGETVDIHGQSMWGKWTSDNEAVATVTGSRMGVVKGVSAGTATITNSYTDIWGATHSKSYVVKVTPATGTKTVTFNANGGTISGSSSIKVEAGTTINSTYGAEMPTASRNGYLFVGWFTKQFSPNVDKTQREELALSAFSGDTVVNTNTTVYAYYVSTSNERPQFTWNLAMSNASVAAGGNKHDTNPDHLAAVTVEGMGAPGQYVKSENLKDGITIKLKPGYKLESISWRCNNDNKNGYNCANFNSGQAASIEVGATGEYHISYGMLQGLSHETTKGDPDKGILMLVVKKDTTQYSVKYQDTNPDLADISASLVDKSYLEGEGMTFESPYGFNSFTNTQYTLAPISDAYKAAAEARGYEFLGWTFHDEGTGSGAQDGFLGANECGKGATVVGNRVYTAKWAPVSFTKTADKTDYTPGDTITYTLKYKNNGDDAVQNIVVEDTLPNILTDIHASAGATVSGQKVSQTFATIQPDEEVTITITAKIADDAPAGAMKNTATANGKESSVEVNINRAYSYTVHYYWNGTTDPVATDMVVDNVTFGETYEELPVSVPGYTPVSDQAKSVTIGESGNEIIFYYYKNVELTANSDSKVYNGSEQSVSGYSVSGPSNIAATFDNVTAGATGIDVGEYAATFSEGAVGKVDTTGKYIVASTVDGKLTITPFTDKVVVTIQGNSDSAVYDGTEHTVTGYKVTAISSPIYSADNVAFSGTAEAKRTDVGTTEMVLTDAQFANVNDNFTNVEFVVTNGSIEITPITTPITITANSATKVYDGKALTDDGFTYTPNILAKGDLLTAVVEGSITDVGSTSNKVISYKVWRGTTDVTANYTFDESVDGTLEITKRPVTLTSATETKVYDGIALTSDAVTVGNDGFAAGEGASYDVTGSQLNVGSSDNTFTYTLNAGTKASNYDITTANGTLTVTPVIEQVVVTIQGNSDSAVYDGNEHTVTGYEVGSISNPLYAVGDFTFSGTAEAKRTDVGTTYMNLAETQFANANPNFANVTFVVDDGWMEVTPAPIPTPTPTPEPPVTPEPPATPVPPTTPDGTPIPEPLNSVVTAMEDAAAPLTQIGEENAPLANHTVCWVHLYMIIGMVIAALYGAAVIGHRAGNSRRLLKQEEAVMGDAAKAKQQTPVAGRRAKQPSA